jgi:peptidoglycan/LPS O-acetylase OafA/YrhL
MTIGGLFALLLFDKHPVLSIFYNKFVQLLAYFVTIALMFFPPNYGLSAFFFSIIILNLASNSQSIISLQFRWLDYLGKVSYGLYMYHPMIIILVLVVLTKLDIANHVLIYLSVLAFSILAASISYNFFERRFIKMKLRYSKVQSGDNVKNSSIEAKV